MLEMTCQSVLTGLQDVDAEGREEGYPVRQPHTPPAEQ